MKLSRWIAFRRLAANDLAAEGPVREVLGRVAGDGVQAGKLASRPAAVFAEPVIRVAYKQDAPTGALDAEAAVVRPDFARADKVVERGRGRHGRRKDGPPIPSRYSRRTRRSILPRQPSFLRQAS